MMRELNLNVANASQVLDNIEPHIYKYLTTFITYLTINSNKKKDKGRIGVKLAYTFMDFQIGLYFDGFSIIYRI